MLKGWLITQGSRTLYMRTFYSTQSALEKSRGRKWSIGGSVLATKGGATAVEYITTSKLSHLFSTHPQNDSRTNFG